MINKKESHKHTKRGSKHSHAESPVIWTGKKIPKGYEEIKPYDK